MSSREWAASCLVSQRVRTLSAALVHRPWIILQPQTRANHCTLSRYKYIYTYTYTSVYIFIYTYIHIYIHTHTHTHTILYIYNDAYIMLCIKNFSGKRHPPLLRSGQTPNLHHRKVWWDHDHDAWCCLRSLLTLHRSLLTLIRSLLTPIRSDGITMLDDALPLSLPAPDKLKASVPDRPH